MQTYKNLVDGDHWEDRSRIFIDVDYNGPHGLANFYSRPVEGPRFEQDMQLKDSSKTFSPSLGWVANYTYQRIPDASPPDGHRLHHTEKWFDEKMGWQVNHILLAVCAWEGHQIALRSIPKCCVHLQVKHHYRVEPKWYEKLFLVSQFVALVKICQGDNEGARRTQV